jgi:ParB family transcriptional regulator, chromosome partitioning protein
MQKNSSLGKGLAELLGEKNFSFTNYDNSKRISEIALDSITASPYQPRKNFDEGSLAELAESIKTKGVLQPILVRRSSNGKHEIVAGERRFRAAALAGLTTIPALVLDISNHEAMEIALIENIQRQQLSPIEEAQAIARLINDLEYTHDSLSEKIGKSRSHITNMLRLLNLPATIQELLAQDKITVGHARALISLKNPEVIVTRIISEGLTVRDTEEIVKHSKMTDLKSTKVLDKFTVEKKQYLSQIREQIENLIQLKTKVTHNGKKGSVDITFKTIGDLETFLQKIHSN